MTNPMEEALNELPVTPTDSRRAEMLDYFAAHALQGLVAGLYANPNNCGWTVQGNCVAAYEYAQAMLVEREKWVK